MPDVRTLDLFQNALDIEMAWRVKEVGTFVTASKSDSKTRKAFVRAGVALLYAHWEGFVKESARLYLEFVSHRGHSYGELQSCFSVIGLSSKLNKLTQAKNVQLNVEAFDFIKLSMSKRAQINKPESISTNSNLSSNVFKNILFSVGLAPTKYETKFNLIDESLVRRRNKIAHGEYLDIDYPEFQALVKEILLTMRWFKTDLLNAASLKSYEA